MKKDLLFLLVMVLTLGFTACGGDDDKTAPEQIAGTYNGDLAFTTQEGPQTTENDVVLEVKSDTTVGMTLKNFNFPPIVGDLQINKIDVVTTVTGFTLSGQGIVMVDLTGSGTANVPATVTIGSGSTVVGKLLTLAISVSIPTGQDTPPLVIGGIGFIGTKK